MASPASSINAKCEPLPTAGSVFFVSSNGRVLRLPIPSRSYRDPLTWSWSKRLLAFLALLSFSIASAFELNLPGLLLIAIHNEFKDKEMGPFQVQSLSSAMTLFTGLGYLIGIPLSTAVGRRPVLVGAAMITTLSTLWAGYAGTFYELLVAVSLQALAGGSASGMFILTTIDATFIHERPTALSLFWCLGCALIKLSLLIVPLTIDPTKDWRCVYKVWLAPCILAFILVLVCVPETYFLRPPVALDGRVLVQSSSEGVQVYGGWDEVEDIRKEKPLPDVPIVWSFWSHFKVTRAPGTKWESMLATYGQMVLCILNPLTFWVSLLAGVILSGIILLNLTQPTDLIDIYGAKAADSTNMLLGISGIIGSLLAFPATGPLAAWFTWYNSFKRGGIRHAEVYLTLFAIPVTAGFASVILNGLAIAYKWNNNWIFVTSAISIISYLTGNVAFTLWITEAFPRWAAAALAVQLFTGNMVGFGIGTGIAPWIEQDNVLEPTILISVLILVLGAMAVPAAFWGKTVRQYIQGRWSDSERTALRPQ
ncbi:mfs general substrate transporter [Fusarium austroafricanum]|uniref:Mfs general substrate transporter n=1 Tax=Fusarium austroafricanum TaxID=2364996 RepID=A0A8H4KDV8_9HYPO|nr:mfs general substrate transporter [Fusarium austroafricanum]